MRRAALQTLSGKPVGRRRFLAGLAGAGALAAGAVTAASAARKKLLKQSLRHEITFGLSLHGSLEDAEHYRQAISVAKALGQPYHAIGDENAATPKGKLEQWFLNKKTAFDKLREHRDRPVGQGKTRKEALEEVRRIMHATAAETSTNPNYSAAIDLLAFEHGLPTIPIEEYSKQEVQEMDRLDEEAISLASEAVGEKARLSEQVEDIEKSVRLSCQVLRARNQRIRETIPKVLALLRKHYPRLAREPQLRILYNIGEMHSGVIEPPRFNERSESPSFSPTKLSLTPQITHELSANPSARLSEDEKNRLVLAYQLYGWLSAMGAARDFEEISRVRAGLSRAGKEDFERLDEITAGKPYSQKAALIAHELRKKIGE